MPTSGRRSLIPLVGAKIPELVEISHLTPSNLLRLSDPAARHLFYDKDE
jgi:hypothetical protein